MSVSTPPAPHVQASTAPADASAELLAFVSLARVTSGTPTLTDVGALAWTHLRQLVPGASLALFTVDPAQRTLAVEYSAGPAADRLAGTAMSVGQRVSGWVAADASAMANVDAQLDLARADADLRWAVAVPLVAEATVVGVMTVYGPTAFAGDCSRRLEMIAPHLAVLVATVVTARTGMNAAFAPPPMPVGSLLARARV